MEMKYQLINHNPQMDNARPMYHYAITLSHSGKTFETFYSVGIGHSKLFSDSAVFQRALKGTYIQDTIGRKYHGNVQSFPWHRNYDKPFFKQVFEAGKRFLEPLSIDAVLSCLVSDALTAENSPLFSDFCSEFGYDEDSRKAYKIWETIREQGELFRRFCGPELFDELVTKYEDY